MSNHGLIKQTAAINQLRRHSTRLFDPQALVLPIQYASNEVWQFVRAREKDGILKGCFTITGELKKTSENSHNSRLSLFHAFL